MLDKECGIYCIQSKIYPERFYIGSSKQIRTRKNSHIIKLRYNTHVNIKLSNHVKKYGLADLEFFTLELCDKSELLIREQFYFDILDPFFNILKIAGSSFGIKLTPEQLKRHKGRTGQKTSQETKDRIGLANKGRKPSDLAIKNSLVARLNKEVSDEEKIRSSNIYLKRKIRNNIDGIVSDKRFPNGYSSVYIGVYYEPKKRTNNHWAVRVRISKQYSKRIGRFDSPEKAAIEYNKYILENNIKNKSLNVIQQ